MSASEGMEEHNFNAVQTENQQLRDYILNLQARLLENQPDFPEIPAQVKRSSGVRLSSPPPESLSPLEQPSQGGGSGTSPAGISDRSSRTAVVSQTSLVKPEDHLGVDDRITRADFPPSSEDVVSSQVAGKEEGNVKLIDWEGAEEYV